MKHTVDIVLPCYNPNNNWYQELAVFNNYVKDQYNLHFIIVNDGSGPNEIIDQVGHLKEQNVSIDYVFYTKNMGKGHALRQGVRVSKSKFVVYTDVDFPFTNESTANLIKTLVSNNYDVVAGFRDRHYYLKNMSSYRKFLSKSFRFFIKNILKMTVTDTQCGLKGFNEKGKEKFLQTTINRYLFDFEFIYSSGKDPDINLQTVQVKLKDGIVFSKMKLKILLQEIINLIYVLAFRKN